MTSSLKRGMIEMFMQGSGCDAKLSSDDSNKLKIFKDFLNNAISRCNANLKRKLSLKISFKATILNKVRKL